jgi:hypothetical protein
VEVSAVDRTGPVSVSMVSKSNNGDTENAMGNGSDRDSGDNRGDDSADEGVKVMKMLGVRGRDVLGSECPDDARLSESVGSVSGSIGSWIQRVSSSWRVRCGHG